MNNNNREILKSILLNECPYGINKRQCKLWKPRRLKPTTIVTLCEILVESEIEKYLTIHKACENELRDN